MPRAALFALAALLLLAGEVPAGEAPPNEVTAVAEQGISVFFRTDSMETLRRFGLRYPGEVSDLKLGEAFRIYTVAPQDFLNEDDGMEFRSHILAAGSWQFIVEKSSRAIAMIMVDQVDGQWAPVSLGSAGLASQLSAMRSVWPASEGYEFRLIRIYEATSDILELSRGDSYIGMIPLTSARIAMGLQSSDLDPHAQYSEAEVLTSLRPLVRRNLAANAGGQPSGPVQDPTKGMRR